MKKLLFITLMFAAFGAKAQVKGNDSIAGYYKLDLIETSGEVVDGKQISYTKNVFGREYVKIDENGRTEIVEIHFHDPKTGTPLMQVDRVQLFSTEARNEYRAKTLESSCAGIDPQIKAYENQKVVAFISGDRLVTISREKPSAKLYVSDEQKLISAEEYNLAVAKAYRTAKMVCMNENIQNVPSTIKEVK